MRTEKLKEREEKYLLKTVNKTSLWSKEFIVYQWYDTNLYNGNSERKLKFIFDLLNVSLKAVKVEKIRIEQNVTEKKVYYLSHDDIDLQAMLKKPFVAKRRSINQNLFLDYFLKSNNACEYLLEVEDEFSYDLITKNKEFTVLRNVTAEKSYYNQNMTIPFSENDLIELEFLMKCFLA